jgi:hypothetical protein
MNSVLRPAYMPVLRTRDGERQALLGLEPTDRAELLPLFDVQAPDPDVSVDEQLRLAIEFVREAWPAHQEFLLDISQWRSGLRTASGLHPVQYLFSAFGEVARQPTICFALDRNDESYEAAFLAVTRGQGQAAKVAYRLQQHDLLFWGETLGRIDALQAASRVALDRVTVIADLQSLRGPQTVDTSVLKDRLLDLSARGYERLVVLGSNMPESESLPRDGELEVRRLEVDMWEALLRAVPSLVFGDYGIIHPTSVYIPRSGMAIPAPKAKYTLPTRWQVIKGHKPVKGEASQYRKIARALTKASWFRANDYGWGNENIRDVASARRGSGNNTDWVAFTTQVHLATTVKQVSVAVRAATATNDATKEGG